jgi:hypothetical protein
MDRIDHKLDRVRFPNILMKRTNVFATTMATRVSFTTSGHFSTPALIFAVTETDAQSVMFSY